MVSVTNIGFSQKKGCVSLSLGSSLPVGAFANKYPDNNLNNPSGYAKLGTVIDISFTQTLYKNYGLAASIYAHANPTDHQNLVDYLSQQPPGAGNISQGTWATGAVLIGIYSSYILTERLRIEPQLLFSYAKSDAPRLKAYNLDGSGGYPSWIYREFINSKHAVILLARTVLKYDLGTRFCILTNIDLMATKSEFKDRKTVTNLGSEYHSFTQKIRIFNFSLGIGYQF